MLNLTFACNDYDHVRDIFGPEVITEGLSLTQLKLPVEEIFFRFIRFGEFEVAEHSFAKYVNLKSKDQSIGVAIPVFPSRVFRHSAIYVRTDSGITAPRDLEGKRVGIPEWGQTAGVYVRGALSDQFGVDLRSITWIQAGVRQPGRVEKVNFDLPKWIKLQPDTQNNLNDLLISGAVDAVITAHPIQAFKDKSSQVVRMFNDFRRVELEYFNKTQCFPIMHTIVIKNDVLTDYPWVAQTIYKGLDEAKRRCVSRLIEPTVSAIPMPWIFSVMQDSQNLYGHNDIWAYGIEENRTTIETFTRYCFEQGIANRLMAPEELFFENTFESFKV